MDGQMQSLCFILVIVVTIILAVWGFMDLLKRQQASEPTMDDVISRQIRGFGILVLSLVVLSLGMALCGAGGRVMMRM